MYYAALKAVSAMLPAPSRKGRGNSEANKAQAECEKLRQQKILILQYFCLAFDMDQCKIDENYYTMTEKGRADFLSLATLFVENASKKERDTLAEVLPNYFFLNFI